MESMDSRSHEVFISYSSKNKNVADAIVADLEQHGIRCWYAPRDVLPGEVWTSEINKVMRETTVFILIYTEDSNKSQQVTNEVTLAVSNGKTIIPFRLTKAGMNDTLGYYLSSLHWLDAVDPPLGRNIEILREKVTSILAIEKEAAEAEGTVPGQAAGTPGVASYSGSGSSGSASYRGPSTSGGASNDGDKPQGKTLGVGILIGIIAAAVVCIGGMMFLRGGKSDTAQKADSSSAVVEQAEAQQDEATQQAGADQKEEATQQPEAVQQEEATQQTEAVQQDEATQQEEAAQQEVEQVEEAAKQEAAQQTESSQQEVKKEEESAKQEPAEEEEETQVLIPDKALSYKGHHYFVYNDVKTSWNDAAENCKERGGYLAVINDSAENEKVYKYMVSMGYEQAFFGLIFNTATDDWGYLYGDKSDFRDWGVNSAGVQEPNDDGGKENHTQFDVNMSDGHWNDAKFGAHVYTPEGVSYKNRYTYICEWDQ